MLISWQSFGHAFHLQQLGHRLALLCFFISMHSLDVLETRSPVVALSTAASMYDGASDDPMSHKKKEWAMDRSHDHLYLRLSSNTLI
jgi:hypothetical protein